MPNILPPNEYISSGKIKFFTLDTSVIKSAGYKFNEGKLADLYLQLPYQLRLILPEVIRREIISHKENEWDTDFLSLISSIEKLDKKYSIDFPLNFNVISLRNKYLKGLNTVIDNYISKFNGNELKIMDCDIVELFDAYFKPIAPFERNKEKKNEFPDAVCLLLLEGYAKNRKEFGVIISEDLGWKKFAENSDNLYYAKSIKEFSELFVANGDNIADKIRERVSNELSDIHSSLYSYIKEELTEQLYDVFWDTTNIYSENVSFCDAEAFFQDLDEFKLQDVNIWKSDKDGATWVLELDMKLMVNLDVLAEFFIKDPIDKDFHSFGKKTLNIDIEPEFSAHMICSNIDLNFNYEDWDFEISLTSKQYTLEEMGVYCDFRMDDI